MAVPVAVVPAGVVRILAVLRDDLIEESSKSLNAPLSYSIVVKALVEDGQKIVTVPDFNPLLERTSAIWSVIS